ncbi:uncharacterized protein LOC131648486 [Vicia villosa]|uniref:uncharacterized protein LOC131648486 n=1 Tax=Vicia villosa TaxID=3911 RepID=UPI00273B64B0|nr:uncharacterized protein LOC131648486 [Vicia villosa]
MDSAAVSHGAPIHKGNKSSDSKVSRKYINDDIAFYVLSKLPIKSLKRFACVRKSWSILFDNSHFIALFRNHLKSNSWRVADIDMSQWYFGNAFTANEVYMDGACHWLVTCNNDKSWLMSFDLSDEVFFTTSMDENLDFYKHLVVLNGSIAIISNHDDDLIYHISILGQVGVKESWIKLLSFSTIPSIDAPPYPVGVGKMGYVYFRKKDDDR